MIFLYIIGIVYNAVAVLLILMPPFDNDYSKNITGLAMLAAEVIFYLGYLAG